MDLNRRIQILRLIQKIEAQPVYAKQLGVKVKGVKQREQNIHPSGDEYNYKRV